MIKIVSKILKIAPIIIQWMNHESLFHIQKNVWHEKLRQSKNSDILLSEHTLKCDKISS